MKCAKKNLILPFYFSTILFIFLFANTPANTIYVGPSETYTTISAAITAASAGDTIIVRDGTYDEDLFIDKSLTIKAENLHGAIIGDGTGSEGLITIGKSGGVSNVTVDGFKLNDMNGLGILVGDQINGTNITNCIIKNNYIQNRSYGIVETTNSNNCTISGNTIIGSSGHGVTQNGVGTNIISNNIIQNSVKSGINITSSFSGSLAISDNTINNNSRHGVEIHGSNITLLGNTIETNISKGVTIYSGVSNVTLTNNNIRDNMEGVSSEVAIKLRSNTIENNNDTGVQIFHSGIDLGQDSDTEAGLNVIRNNVVWNIVNFTQDTIHAYRNYWGLTNANDIDTTIKDNDEDNTLGPVDFLPFLTDIPTDVEQNLIGAKIPKYIELSPAYPNPFNPGTKITYKLSKPTKVTLKVVNLLGQTVRTILSSSYQNAGIYTTSWNGKTDTGKDVSSGMYILILNSESIIKSQKLMLLK